jgi:hypothetical protein
MSPEQFLQKTKNYYSELQEMQNLAVKVGLPSEKVGTKIYDDGQSVIEVGAQHEFGGFVPRRSFLRVPFIRESDRIQAMLNKEAKRIYNGETTASKALGLVGTFAENLSKQEIDSEGQGSWEKSNRAIEQGGTTLYDNGTLRNSITSAVVSD